MDEGHEDGGQPPPVDVVLCVGAEACSRLWGVIRHLCVGLVDLNARVRLLSSSPEVERLTLGPIETIVHQEPVWPLRRRRLGQVVEVLGSRPPTVVHAISADSFRVAQAVAQTFEVDLVAHLTAADDVAALGRLTGYHVEHAVAASRPLFDAVEQTGRLQAEEVTLIRPGVLRSEQPTCFTKPGFLPALLCTADLEQGSGVDHLISAVRTLRDAGRELLLFVLGGGSRERELRKLTQDKQVLPWVTFARPKADRSAIMAGADVFVHPGPEQAISFNSLSAMATGTLVITCAGGISDHCHDGHTAIVCPDNSPKALAAGIERALTDHEYARTLAAAGIAYVKEHHSVATMAERSMLLYQQLALRRRMFPIK